MTEPSVRAQGHGAEGSGMLPDMTVEIVNGGG